MKAGDVVVCRFPGDHGASTIALCLLVALDRTHATVRKAAGNPPGWRMSRWRWSGYRRIPREDALRAATAREQSVRHVIGGAAGEKLTGDGAGELRR